MAESNVNHGKRRFLVGATSVVGGIGVAAAATPFVMSFFPSERAKAAGAPVDIDIAKLEPGQKIDIEESLTELRRAITSIDDAVAKGVLTAQPQRQAVAAE